MHKIYYGGDSMSKYVKKTYPQMVVDSYNRSMEQDLRVEEIDEERCMVVNIEGGTLYNVFMSEFTIDDCQHHYYRQVPCKHMFAAAEFFRKSI